ncbi:hypothetical protein PENSPDRAFT_153505 [Peniophora sp. CONT]|nr:hypothetical protein PENSPDRAFT_153505 [Peniophora sp. CONT]
MPGKHNPPPNKAWGTRFDSLRTVPASPPAKDVSASTDHSQYPSTPSKNTVGSNDSSVFVGSLPPNVDYVEISHRLADHLQDYTDIRKVKVIRDHRGGACAFIQCKDSDAAKLFIRDVHARPPPPFMGRNLRFEQARSSRTLLFSYRVPLRVLDDAGNVEHLEPAGAMRLFRPAGERYIHMLYNAEAVHFQLHPSQVVTSAGPLDNGGMLFAPLRYDAQTLHTIVSAFGSLEHVIPYQPDTPDGSYPSPHDALRAPIMDPTCWEVKWEQREDSMAALMALRTVPHISVSWAHLVGQRPGEQIASPFTPSVRVHPFLGTPSTWISPIRLPGYRSAHVEIRPMAPLRLAPPSDSDGDGTNTAAATYAPTPRGSVDAGTPEDDIEPGTVMMMGTPAAQTQRKAATPHSAVSVLANGSPVRVTASLHSLNDSVQTYDDDLQPLATRSLSEGAGVQLMANMVNLGEPAINQQVNAPPVLTLDTAMQAATQGRVSLEEAFRALAVSRNTSADDSTAILTPTSAAAQLETPDTPYDLRDPKDMGDEGEVPIVRSLPPHLAPSTRQKLDHSTIFVGGLEMFGPNAWTEDLVQEVFGHYGEIENTKFIRPTTKKSAFAFVRFRDTESSARAVKTEHNKMYNNRQIRVQIREHNPHRPFFAFSRAAATVIAQRSQQQQQPRQRWPSTEQQRAAQLQAEPMRPPLHPRRSSGSVASMAASPARSVAPTRPASTVPPTSDPFVVNPQAQHLHRAQSLPQAVTPSRTPQPPTAMTAPPPQAIGQQPGTGYFMAHQYMMPQFPYPMPFAPYTGFVAPPQGPGHEAGTPPAGMPPGAQPAFFPFPYPIVAPPMHLAERPSSASETHHASPGQIPPLIPTSFVQGEHGLMPVYSPEALGQYNMHMMRAHGGSGGPPTPSHDRPPHPAQAGPMPGWPGFTYGYPPPAPPASPNRAHATNWYPPVQFGVPYPTPASVPPPSGLAPGQPLAPINVNALLPNSGPPPAPRQPGGRASTRSTAENMPIGENRSGASSASNGSGGKRLTAQTRELYGDVHVPVIGAGPPPIPLPGRAPRQQHRKGSASMEVNQASPERGQNVTESRSSPLVSRAVVAQGVQAQQ